MDLSFIQSILRREGIRHLSGICWYPISFHDASYQFVTTMETVSNEHTLYTALPYNKSASYVDVMRKFLLADNSITVGSSTRSFDAVLL